jgi:hypothetical protein
MYYALCFVYLQSNDKIKAKQVAIKLKELDPTIPNISSYSKTLEFKNEKERIGSAG